MKILFGVFVAIQAATSWYGVRRGGMPERAVAGLLVIAAIASVAGGSHDQYRSVDIQQLAIDTVLLAALIAIALRANRFWPLWMAALQLLAVGAHLVRAHDPTILPAVYVTLFSRMAYAICFTLVVGTWHFHRRSRLQGERPRDWSRLRW